MKEYIPKSLRKEDSQRKVMYAIGTEHAPNEFGMWMGPTLDKKEMLDTIGEERAVIIRFNKDGTDEIIWRWKEDRWIAVEE